MTFYAVYKIKDEKVELVNTFINEEDAQKFVDKNKDDNVVYVIKTEVIEEVPDFFDIFHELIVKYLRQKIGPFFNIGSSEIYIDRYESDCRDIWYKAYTDKFDDNMIDDILNGKIENVLNIKEYRKTVDFGYCRTYKSILFTVPKDELRNVIFGGGLKCH